VGPPPWRGQFIIPWSSYHSNISAMAWSPCQRQRLVGAIKATNKKRLSRQYGTAFSLFNK
ncbi:MAG: hypothetical protein AAFV78_17620, partial [Bacteroidota bacterium]